MEKEPQIATWRKVVYYTGLVLTIIGFILFFSGFLSFGSMMANPWDVAFPMIRPIIGFILIFVGAILMQLGKRGLAGSGVILDPQKAREDYKPFTKAIGGMVNDGLEEVDILKRDTDEVIKIRCRECQTLNDEQAKYCDNCGKAL
ncbi:MAG: zinc ribbon domain-containing protein [Eubacteriales bacterium]|nr:zinc ribbon domain-containing protein [Eubacteriales bacterium]MDD4324716.1 zinc ribbon domain-containing protein [Eubacteriales bacterium]MDD4541351.1 zinc ribbon domain-containing protein [Eubacteriales bacterium]